MRLETSSLKQRVLRAGSWVLAGHVASQAIRLASNIIVSRMLAPEAFGLMAVVYVMIVGLTLFSDLGITQTVIQSRRGEDPAFLNTAWSLQILRGAAIGLASLLLGFGFYMSIAWDLPAPLTVYADPRLPWIVASFSIAAFIQGLEPTRMALAKRQMQQQRLTRIELLSQAGAAVAMVLVAWVTRSVWALALGALLATALRCALAHWLLPGHKDRWAIDRSAKTELLRQGKWILPASILGFVAINGDRLVLGGLIDTHNFGLYSIALLLISSMNVVSGMLCGNVAYPALSECARDRPAEFWQVFAKFQWAYDALVVTLTAVLITSGPAIVGLIYDHRYEGSGWMLSILAAGAIGMRYQLVEQCYLALTQAQFITLTSTVRLVALLTGLLLGEALHGLTGAIVGMALSQYATWPIALWFKYRQGALTWRAELLLLPSLALGLGLGWGLSKVIALLAH